jgi:hypothetical protein
MNCSLNQANEECLKLVIVSSGIPHSKGGYALCNPPVTNMRLGSTHNVDSSKGAPYRKISSPGFGAAELYINIFLPFRLQVLVVFSCASDESKGYLGRHGAFQYSAQRNMSVLSLGNEPNPVFNNGTRLRN